MKCGITPENVTALYDNEVFVFGSNLAGQHGAGAAYTALQWGAEMGQGEGLYGKTYALPTKDLQIRTRHIHDIYMSVVFLLQSVRNNPNKHFIITKIGCGLAGLSVEEVAPLFREFINLDNCSLPQDFINVINQQENING